MNLAIQFGAGNIGRGFIGYLLSKSGYKVVFVDINEEIIEKINTNKKYKVFVKDTECYEEEVNNILAINSLASDIVERIYKANIITTAIGPSILCKIANTIAKTIIYRKEKHVTEQLIVIACENMVCATSFLKDEIYKYLNEDEVEYANKYVAFPNSSVDRIVPPVKSDNILDVTVEKFYEWNVEKESLKSFVPNIEGMNLVENLPAYIERKLFTLNTGHAITSYLGFVKGYKTIDQSIRDEKIQNIVRKAMQESGRAISKKYDFDLEKHFEYIEKIIDRFKNQYLNDDVLRVSREPIRKLSEKDRLIKPLNTAMAYGYEYENLLTGIASVFHYKNIKDDQSIEINKYLDVHGIKDTVTKFTGINNEEILLKIEDKFNSIKEILK